MLDDYSVPRTRILVPHRRRDLITRPRLLEIVNEIIDHKLFLVTAPAGYGKTSLLVDFSEQTTLPVCWYSISSQDFEPQRFIANLISAIMVQFPRFGQRSISALQSTRGNLDIDYTANLLVNDLYDHVQEHFVLVLDDYYLVNDNTMIRSFITRFIQDVDENCHLVMTSRQLLPLPVISWLAARSEVSGISFEELAFQEDEIQQLFLQNHQYAPNEQETSEILERTEGWITGILLKAPIYPDRLKKRAGSTRLSATTRLPGAGLEDFFLQLIQQQAPEMYDLLLRTSLLGEFNQERCELVLGQALGLTDVNWGNLLERLLRENLFVLQVGEDGSWLRYHHLFLDFLQSHILHQRPEEVRLIERRLARYYMGQGDWENAFPVLQKLGQADELVHLIAEAGPEMLGSGRLSTLSAWLDTLPGEMLSAQPMIVSLQGAIASTTGDARLALMLFDQAINSMCLPQDARAMARGLVWRAGTYRMLGQYADAVKDAFETIRLVDADLMMRKVKAEALRCIGLCLDKQGKPLEALEWLSQALTTSQTIKDRENAAIIQLGMGVVYENLGNYTQSMAAYQAALNHWQQTQNISWLASLYNNLGVLQHITGQYRSAISSYEMGLQYARKSGNTRFEAFVLTGIGDIYIELDANDQAVSAYQQASVIAQQLNINFLRVYLGIQEAIIACTKGNFAESCRLLEAARQTAVKEKMPLEMHLCDLEYAGVKIKQGKPAEVVDLLEQVSAFFAVGGHKTQIQKANFYQALAYGLLADAQKFFPCLLRVLAFLHSEPKPTFLIATANRFYDQLVALRSLDYLVGQLDDLFARINEFWNELPDLRRYIRQHAITVPFAPPVLAIRALGKMQVRVNSQMLTISDFQTQAARDLFFMLLAHPEGKTRDELGEVFWPEASAKDIKFRMKNTVYRLRHALGREVVLLDQENYRFNNQLDYEYDVEQFLKENALGLQTRDPLQKLAHFREAAKLYKGDFLPEIAETWVLPLRESLRQICFNILLQTAEIYLEMANYSLALDYCQRALLLDDCSEIAYRLSFRIYAAMGDRAAVARQYSRCCETLAREINTEPSPQTQTLYQELFKGSQ